MKLLATVYALIDPITEEIRYIGWTSAALKKRLYEHLYCSRRKRTHKDSWLRFLTRLSVVPEIRVVQTVPVISGNEAERYWISYFRSIGCRLTNLTDGGEGILGHKRTLESKELSSRSLKAAWQRRRSSPQYSPPRPTEKSIGALRRSNETRRGTVRSDETKAKMKLAWQRRRLVRAKPRKPHSLETKEKLRQAALRQFQDPKAREAISRVHKGKSISSKQREAISQWGKKRWAEWRASGATISDETREKIRLAKLGKAPSIETRAKLSAATKGRPKSAEHKAKISMALRSRNKL